MPSMGDVNPCMAEVLECYIIWNDRMIMMRFNTRQMKRFRCKYKERREMCMCVRDDGMDRELIL